MYTLSYAHMPQLESQDRVVQENESLGSITSTKASTSCFSAESQGPVSAPELMRSRAQYLQSVTLLYYWLSGPRWVGQQKFWGCICSSSLKMWTDHICLHLECSLCHPPPVVPAPHCAPTLPCDRGGYSFCGLPLVAVAMVRVKASCTGPRGASTAADGGCDGFCDDLGGSETLRAPSPQHEYDPRLTNSWADPLFSHFSGPCLPVLVVKHKSERRWSL